MGHQQRDLLRKPPHRLSGSLTQGFPRDKIHLDQERRSFYFAFAGLEGQNTPHNERKNKTASAGKWPWGEQPLSLCQERGGYRAPGKSQVPPKCLLAPGFGFQQDCVWDVFNPTVGPRGPPRVVFQLLCQHSPSISLNKISLRIPIYKNRKSRTTLARAAIGAWALDVPPLPAPVPCLQGTSLGHYSLWSKA